MNSDVTVKCFQTRWKVLFTLLFLFCSVLTYAQSIHGRVVDPEGKPIAGVSVRILNEQKTTQTDELGHFESKNILNREVTIRFTALGYAAQQVSATVGNAISVTMQPSYVHLDATYVSATREDQDPVRLPISLSVIDGKTLESRSIRYLQDLSGSIPNLIMAHPGEYRNVTSIRGITTTSYSPAVATYVDGVNQFSLDTYMPFLVDVERVEILRGPQGLLYGRNAMGGVINVITKQPTNQTTGQVEVGLGDYGQQRGVLSVRTPLVKDQLFLGVTGLYQGSDGFYTNTFDQSSYDKQHLASGNYFLKYLPTDRWAITLNVKHASNRNQGAFPLVFGKEAAFEEPFKLNQNAKTTMVDESRNASLSLHYTGNNYRFTSQTAFQQNYRYYKNPIDGDFSPMDAMSIINNYGTDWNRVKVWTQEFRINGIKSDALLDWSAGASFFHQKSPTKQGTYYGADAGMMGAPFTDVTSILSNISKGMGGAVYGQLGYQWTDRLHLSAGLRADLEEIGHEAMGEFQQGQNPAVITQDWIEDKTTFFAFSPSAQVSYAWQTDLLSYFNYSRGFRAGGLSPLGSDPSEPALRGFKPEYSDMFEIGTKQNLLGGNLQWSAALFYTEVKDAQVPMLVLPDAITLTRNTGNLRSQGAEADIHWQAYKGLSFGYQIGFTHARYTDLLVAGEGENAQLKGNRPMFTPSYTSNLSVQYAFRFGSAKSQGIQLGAQWRAVGDQYFDLENQLSQDAYQLLDAQIAYDYKGYTLQAWMHNINDARYIDYGYNFGAVHLARPKTMGLSLRKAF
jgi:iron complex outermembrane receptor protein